MLENVISDERQERRNLVMETQQAQDAREQTLEDIHRMQLELQEVKRERLQADETADRYKTLLAAQERRAVDFRRISFLIYKGLMVEDERFFSQSEKKRAS